MVMYIALSTHIIIIPLIFLQLGSVGLHSWINCGAVYTIPKINAIFGKNFWLKSRLPEVDSLISSSWAVFTGTLTLNTTHTRTLNTNRTSILNIKSKLETLVTMVKI